MELESESNSDSDSDSDMVFILILIMKNQIVIITNKFFNTIKLNSIIMYYCIIVNHVLLDFNFY